MQNFTPLAGLIGGVLIGLGSAVLLLAVGRLAGVSGMLESVLRPQRAGAGLALAFLIGLRPIGLCFLMTLELIQNLRHSSPVTRVLWSRKPLLILLNRGS